MADLTPDQLDALAKGIIPGIAQEKTLQALVKALGGKDMASVVPSPLATLPKK